MTQRGRSTVDLGKMMEVAEMYRNVDLHQSQGPYIGIFDYIWGAPVESRMAGLWLYFGRTGKKQVMSRTDIERPKSFQIFSMLCAHVLILPQNQIDRRCKQCNYLWDCWFHANPMQPHAVWCNPRKLECTRIPKNACHRQAAYPDPTTLFKNIVICRDHDSEKSPEGAEDDKLTDYASEKSASRRKSALSNILR